MPQDVLARNNVKSFGRGDRTLLLVHGFGCDQNMWRFITPAFQDDYRIVLMDYVGSGKADRAAYDAGRYSSLDGYAQDVLDVCEALDLRHAIYVGHSVSGVVGMLASIREPDRFDELVLVCPSPRYLNDSDGYVGGFERSDVEGLLAMMDKNYMGWAQYLAPAIMQNGGRPELAGELEASFCSTDPVIARRFAEVTFFSDNRDDLPKVERPCLIMQCANDVIAPLEVGAYLHERLTGSTLVNLEATGHCPHMSHPDETIRIIKDYLRQQPVAGADGRVGCR